MTVTRTDHLTSASPTAAGELEERGHELISELSVCAATGKQANVGVEMWGYFLQHSAFERDKKRLFENLTPASPELEERANTQ